MANKIQVKRSAVADKVPTTSDLDLGEIAINTYDGKVYIKKDVSGTPSIVEIGKLVSVNSNATDILSVSSNEISADDAGADKIVFWDDSEGKLTYLTLGDGLSITGTTIASTGGSGVSDGDKGDITVSGSGATWTVDNAVITYAKIQNVSATDRILGRSTAGAGSVEEITCTAAGRAILDDADAAAQRTTLSAAQSGSNTDITSVYLNNTGLKLKDTNASHGLTLAPGSDLTADRTLTLTTGDAARTLTISGDATVSQDYSTTGNPQFASIELGNSSDTTLARSSAGNVSIEGNVIYRAGGTDVPVADGGTGASTAADARTNLGLGSMATEATTSYYTKTAADAAFQPLDSTLTSLGSFNNTGILTQTSADTFVARSLSSGLGINITNPAGTAGNPTIALSHLGIEELTDPNANKVIYWNDTAGKTDWLNLSGSGTSLALTTSPTFTTPTLGVASATTINKVTFTTPATGSTLTIANGKTLTANNSITIAGTDSTTMTFPSTSSNVLTTGNTATITKGYTLTPNAIGTVSSGTTTLDATNGNYQFLINGGAFSLSPPATGTYDALDLLVINGPSAGSITFTAGRWRVGSFFGSTYSTTSRASGTATISNASPAVVTRSSHGCVDGDPVYFTTTGSLPTGLSTNTVYYVKYVSTSTFQLAATPGGTSINTSSAGSGTHTLISCSQYILSLRQIYGSATYSWYALQ